MMMPPRLLHVLPAAVLGCLVCFAVGPVSSQGEQRRGGDEFHGLFRHLENAIEALQKLDRGEQAKKLRGWARELRHSVAQHGEERRKEIDRQALKRQLHILGFAKSAFAEAEKGEALELIEHAMHARELRVEGRRDKEAQAIIERAPKWGAEVELLGLATKLLAEFGAKEKAGATKKLAAEIAKLHRHGGDSDRSRGKRRLTERQVAEQQVETIMYAARILDRSDREDAAESLEHAGHALKLRLQRKRGKEAQRVIRTAPDHRHTATHLRMAAEILTDRGDHEHAEFVAKMAGQFAPRRAVRPGPHGDSERRRAGRKREGPERRRRNEHEHLEQLHERMERMSRAIEEIQEEIQRLKRRDR